WMTDFYTGQSLEWNELHWTGYFHGIGVYSLECAWKLDYIMELAREKGIYLQLVTQHHGQLNSTFTEAQWDENPYNTANGGMLSSPEQFFTNADAKDLYKRKARYTVARWGYATSILCWELWNEVLYTDNAGANVSAITDWHEEMAQYIQSIDPWEHMLTTSVSVNPTDAMSAAVWSLPEIDCTQPHLYVSEITNNIRNKIVSTWTYDKPVIVGEFGIAPIGNRFSDLDGTHIHNGIWSAAMTMTGAMTWWWDDYIHPNDLYYHYAGLSSFFQGEDLRDPTLDVLSLSVDGANGYGIGAGNCAYVWVQDPDHVFGGTPGGTLSGVTVDIPGMANGFYDVEYWNTFSGITTGTEVVECTGGTLSLDIPDFDLDLALKATLQVDGTSPSVTVIAPNGGETWYIDSFFDIMWTASDDVGVTSIDIMLSRDGGMTYPETIAAGETNDGTYSWQVTGTPGVNLRVKVIAYDAAANSGEDESDADFEIAAATSSAHFTIPKSVMENTAEFVKGWGPASITRSEAPDGLSMDFTFSGLTGDGTAIRDDFEVLNEYGQNPSTYNCDFSDFTGYSVRVENLDDAAVWVNLFINTGLYGGTHDTYWQIPEWAYVGPGETVTVSLDFDAAQADHISDNPVPNTGGDLGWADWGTYAINDYDRAQLTNIGFQVADFGKGANPNATLRFSPAVLPPVVVTLESITTVMKCADNITYQVNVDGSAVDLMGADYKLNYDTSKLSFVSATVGDLLNTAPGNIFTYVPNPDATGVLHINSSHLAAGVNGPGTIAEITFTSIGSTSPASTALTFSDTELRDSGNQTLPSTWTGASVVIDCVDPTISVTLDAPVSPWTCYNTAPTVDITAGDDYDLDCVSYDIDGGGYTDITCGISGTSYINNDWALPGFAGLSQGSHTYSFKAKDDAGNESTVASVTFTKDTIAPSAVTDFVATVGHNQVVLDWTNPGGDVDRIYLYRNDWTSYPGYGTADPGYPTVGGFDLQTDIGIIETYTDGFSDNTRGIYAYRAVVYDCAGNYSAAGSDDYDRATSYFLGDIASNAGSWGPNYDGLVSGFDYNPFSGCYWSAPPAGDCMEVDFAPTIEPTRGNFGIPVPDAYVDFDDLMIFAMNYGNVPPAPAPLSDPVWSVEFASAGAPMPGIELVSAGLAEDAGIYRLSLVEMSQVDGIVELALVVEGNEMFKGLSAEIEYDHGGLEFMSALPSEALLGGSRVLFMGGEVDGVLRVDFAALGSGVAIGGNGPVATLSFQRSGDSGSSVQITSADARDVENNVLILEFDGGAQVEPGMPAMFALRGNSPNPFTGSTEIHFDVPREASMSLRIYNIQGQLVRTLVDGSVSAGRYSETWDGLDGAGQSLPSGVYFVRMSADDYEHKAKILKLH
ncbi:FlgD immunoglobulin-like domain containing protein, partial [Candidatus Eisenbacteria bacterium]